MKKKKLCVITGSRADWGLFYPLATQIKKNSVSFILQVIATGGHLSLHFGLTYKEIEKDGFRINQKVKMPLSQDTEAGIVKSVSLGARRITEALKSLKPDLVFLLGDRFEIFAAAIASFFLKIPIAHISGGELTEGSLDDTLRHTITKMAHLHFVSTETYKNRVIQMGEDPKRVFNVGALGIDNIKHTKLLNKKEFEKKINFKLGEKNIMVTFNPATSEGRLSLEKQFKNLLEAIGDFGNMKIIFTKPNPDMYSSTISRLIDGYVAKNKRSCIALVSMGRLLYLSSLQFMDAVVGNSSSGIVEVPSFGIPTVNIGDRQRGRLKPESIINAEPSVESIKDALEKVFSFDFHRLCKKGKNPYGRGESAKKILGIIKTIDTFTFKKRFFDIRWRTI